MAYGSDLEFTVKLVIGVADPALRVRNFIASHVGPTLRCADAFLSLDHRTILSHHSPTGSVLMGWQSDDQPVD
jgi:hypothetical protein